MNLYLDPTTITLWEPVQFARSLVAACQLMHATNEPPNETWEFVPAPIPPDACGCVMVPFTPEEAAEYESEIDPYEGKVIGMLLDVGQGTGYAQFFVAKPDGRVVLCE